MNALRATTCIPGLALYCLLAMPATTAWAERGAYRIEVLVFRHTEAEQNPVESQVLSHFPAAWRLFTDRSVIYPEDPAPLGIMSDRMRDVWRRLERSDAYQPLYMQAWEQSRIDYHPPVRIHDDRVIFERVLLPETADIDLTTPDFLAPFRESFHRLDGTAQLRRSRFLHLEFDLEFRLELIPPESADTPEGGAPVELTSVAVESKLPAPKQPEEQAAFEIPGSMNEVSVDASRDSSLWRPPPPLVSPMPDTGPAIPGGLLYRLQESRQIRTGQLLYFDSPHLGVIARVTATSGE